MSISFKPKPGTVMVIRGDIVEAIDMQFCDACGVWHVDKDHAVRHQEPVEPDIIVKENKIAGLLTY
jgi:hypothetical protein